MAGVGTRTDAINALDFQPTRPCEHPTHGRTKMHPDGPGVALVDAHNCPRCGAPPLRRRSITCAAILAYPRVRCRNAACGHEARMSQWVTVVTYL